MNDPARYADPPTTREVLAVRRLGKPNGASWYVGWATALLADGTDTPALRRLAGEPTSKSSRPNLDLVAQAVRELRLREYETREDAAVAYVTIQLERLLEGRTPMGSVLSDVAGVYIDLGYPCNLRDFYLLQFAREDLLKYGHTGYWKDVDRDSIDELVLTRCRQWLSKPGLGEGEV